MGIQMQLKVLFGMKSHGRPERGYVSVKAERGTTFTFIRELQYIASTVKFRN